MFKVAILGGCVGWRQTGGCSSSGPRESRLDRTCSAIIQNGWSGYCECTDGRKVNEQGCSSGKYRTCNEACSGVKGNKHNIVYTL